MAHNNPNLVHRWVTENRRSAQHELSELSEPKGKSNIPAAPLNWVAAVPVNTGPQKTYTPQAAQHKPPSTARTQSIAIKIAGKQRHITDRKSTRLNSSHVAISYAV